MQTVSQVLTSVPAYGQDPGWRASPRSFLPARAGTRHGAPFGMKHLVEVEPCASPRLPIAGHQQSQALTDEQITHPRRPVKRTTPTGTSHCSRSSLTRGNPGRSPSSCWEYRMPDARGCPTWSRSGRSAGRAHRGAGRTLCPCGTRAGQPPHPGNGPKCQEHLSRSLIGSGGPCLTLTPR